MLNTAEQSKSSTINQTLLLRHKFTVTQQESVLKILRRSTDSQFCGDKQNGKEA